MCLAKPIPKMPLCFALPLALALSACVPQSGPKTLDIATTGPAQASGTLHSFGAFSLFSSRPTGFEMVRDDFLYRQYEVQITCDG